jgi:hypothetical protein
MVENRRVLIRQETRRVELRAEDTSLRSAVQEVVTLKKKRVKVFTSGIIVLESVKVTVQ